MLLTRQDIPIADDDLAARFVGLAVPTALDLAHREVTLHGGSRQTRNDRHVQALLRILMRLEVPETRDWLRSLRAFEDQGRNLALDQQEEIVAWLNSLVAGSRAQQTRRERWHPPDCETVIGDADHLSCMFLRDPSYTPQPGSRAFACALAYALGCRVFRVVRANYIYRPLFAGMVGVVTPQFRYNEQYWEACFGMTFQHLGWRKIDERRNPLFVPLGCMEPATVDDLERAILAPPRAKTFESWLSLYGGQLGSTFYQFVALWTEQLTPGYDFDHEVRELGAGFLADLAVAIERASERMQSPQASARVLHELQASLGRVSVYPGHDDLVAQFAELRMHALELLEKAGHATARKP
jgi:hypothetical protein